MRLCSDASLFSILDIQGTSDAAETVQNALTSSSHQYNEDFQALHPGLNIFLLNPMKSFYRGKDSYKFLTSLEQPTGFHNDFLLLIFILVC